MWGFSIYFLGCHLLLLWSLSYLDVLYLQSSLCDSCCRLHVLSLGWTFLPWDLGTARRQDGRTEPRTFVCTALCSYPLSVVVPVVMGMVPPFVRFMFYVSIPTNIYYIRIIVFIFSHTCVPSNNSLGVKLFLSFLFLSRPPPSPPGCGEGGGYHHASF